MRPTANETELSRKGKVLPGGSAGKESACNVGELVRSLGWEDPVEKGTAIPSGILAWRTPWTVCRATFIFTFTAENAI